MKQDILIKGLLISLLPLYSILSWGYDFRVRTYEEGINVYYNIVSSTDLTCEVTYGGIDCYFGSVTIPKQVTYNEITYTVVGIDGEAFYACSRLSSVTIPTSVTYIGDSAFYGCSSLEEVTIPNSTTTLGDYTFQGCTSLAEVIMGNSVTSIGSFAFYGCSSLIEIKIPNTTMSLGDCAFYGCSSMKTLTIEDGSENLSMTTSSSATPFTNCPIETLYLGRDISYTDNYSPFRDNTSLNVLTLGNNVTTISSYEFYRCTNLPNVIIPNGVTSIGSSAFQDCTSLSQLTIPSSVSSIDSSAFYGCSGLTELTLEDGDEILSFTTSSSATPFTNCPIKTLYLGRDISYYSNYSPFRGNTSLSALTLGNNVTTINTYEFHGCTNLPNVTIPNGVTSVGTYAFSGCMGLTEITIPSSVTEIGEHAFSSCTSLTKVTSLATTPPTIYSTTFDSNVVEAEVPKASLREYALDGIWANIASIYAIENAVKLYPVIISYEGDAIIKVYGGDKNGIIAEEGENVTIMPIGTNKDLLGTVDYNGRDITATLIGDGTYSFAVSEYHKQNWIYSHYVDSDNAFDITLSNRGQLIDEITVSAVNSVYSLRVKGDIDGTDIYTIRRLPNLQYLDLSQANIVSGGDAYYNDYETYNNTIGDYFFSDLSGLKLVKLPDTALTIENYAFRNCTSLVCLNLPSSLNSISSNAFSSCKSIEGINSPNPTPPDISSSTFSSVDKSICVLNVPIGSSSSYWLHKYWGVFNNIYEVDFDRVVDGIKGIPNVENATMYDGDNYQIYTLSGTRVTTPIKGNVYIFRYSDGTTKKVLVK